jgi:hypothetical protein
MKNSFKALYDLYCSQFDTWPEWNVTIEITNKYHLPYIEKLLIEIQKKFQSETIDTYLLFEDTFLNDIILLKAEYNDDLTNESINYLQLLIYTNSIGYFNTRGLFGYSYGSIILSVHDSRIENGETLTIEDKRLLKFIISSNEHINANSQSLIIEWLTHLYYCSFSAGCLVKFGYDFWDISLTLSIKSKRFSIAKFKLLSNLMVWSLNYKKTDKLDISTFLLEEYNKLDWSDDLKIEICTQLILIVEIPIAKRRKFFRELIRVVDLKGHLKLQLLLALTESYEDFKLRFDQILEAAVLYNDAIRPILKSPVLLTFERSRMFKILKNVLIILAKSGKTKELTKLLGSYYDVTCELSDSILYIFPYFEEGNLFAFNETVYLRTQDTFTLTKDLIYLSNQLFNRTLALIGDSNDILIPQKIMGVPSSEYSLAFEKKAYEIYDFRIIQEKFNGIIDGILQLGFNSIPVQSLMLKQIGFTFPIKTSLCKSLPQKKIMKILFWGTGSYTSFFEQSAVTYICQKYKVEFDVIEEAILSKEVFCKLYPSDEYSIVWIASHGEHNNNEPQKSLIIISSTESVSIEELISLKPIWDYNRLLFLNLCESGINSETGGFKGVGFGHQLASNNQSIISHLWMVEPRIAMTFGIVLAIELFAYKKTYIDAYNSAVLTLIKGKSYTLSVLKSEIHELNEVLDRIENIESIDWSNILNWGSTAFYN